MRSSRAASLEHAAAENVYKLSNAAMYIRQEYTKIEVTSFASSVLARHDEASYVNSRVEYA